MKKLKRLVLVQFFLYEAIELEIDGHVAFLGQNGSGKTSILDAIQIAMLGAHGSYLAFNTQSVSATGGGKRNPRSIRDYCLGVVDDTGNNGPTDRKRDTSISYISLVFEDSKTREPVTVGVALKASAEEPHHEVLGLYVLNGISLELSDHLEMGEDGEVPLLYNDFAARTRTRSESLGRTPYFTNQPTKYIQELIHALQPKAKSIDVREYLKVFNKSVLLRNIESVDSFVRDYVVEPQSIDRRRARQQIDMFKQLSELLRQVREQIQDLGLIAGAYEEVARWRIREASIKALAAEYSAREAQRHTDDLKQEISRQFRNRKLYRMAADNHINNVKDAETEWERAMEALHRTPGADTVDAYAQQILQGKRALAMSSRRIEKALSSVAGVIDKIANTKDLTPHQRKAKEIDREVAHQATRLEQEHFTSLDAAVQKALSFLNDEKPALEQALANVANDISVAATRLRTITGQVSNAERNGAPISRDVAGVIEYLRERGIEAEPVCNLVQVTDVRWQPAIESFLKSNREALVVAHGQEREAVRLLRRMSDQDNPFSARIVQPAHLEDRAWNSADAKRVGNLLISDNPTALAYLRALLGDMRCVESEEELEQYRRALTMDGMLSANFSTSRLRLVPADRLQLGKRVTFAEREALRKELKETMDEQSAATEKHQQIADTITRINKLGDLAELASRVANDVSEALEQQKAVNTVTNNLSRINTDQFAELRNHVKVTSELLEKARDSESENRVRLGETDNALRRLMPALWAGRRERDKLAAIYQEKLQVRDVDESVKDRVRSEIETNLDGGGHTERLESCERRITNADREAMNAFSVALHQFTGYLDRHGVALGDELRDWHLALQWIVTERTRLQKSELVEREGEVHKARLAAEEAFRSDVAVRIKESIEQMHTTISDINKTLKACPSFSNGERYRFVVDPATAHEKLHDYIINIGKGGEQDFFSLGDNGHEAIMALLDDSNQDGQKGFNPLDDYRTLFMFDLMIDREGKKSIPLSRRIGVGSNGEHRTPFYVIAGAAMAAAYRIDAGKHSTGAGLMLLDEAFHGMDQQNALSAARFLDTIGLQMVMAAPEADHSKLAPSLDTIFEINRFDMDVFVEQTKIKEPAKTLLMSDVPSEHPDLLTDMVAQLAVATE